MIERIARWCYRHRWQTVGLWLAILVGASAASAAFGGEFHAEYTQPGSESQAAFTVLQERFPARSGDTIDLVYHSESGPLADNPAALSRRTELERRIAELPHVAEIAPRGTSADGTIAAADIRLDVPGYEMPLETTEQMVALASAETAAGGGLQVELGGQTVSDAEVGEIGSEAIGLVAAVIILLIAFGSLLAMGLPLLTALIGLGIASGITMLIARLIDVPDWATSMTAMIGIGVGIDYALFIITRYRSELATGLDPEDAVVRALSTAGRAVLFAGATVVISLLGLITMGLEFLVGTALVTSSAVLIVMLVSITMLPAILGFVGRTIDRLRVPLIGRSVQGTRVEGGFWFRWSRFIQHRPWPAFVIGLVVLLALASPVLGLRIGFPDAGNGPEELTTRRAFDLQTQAFGAGSNGPLLLAAELSPGSRASELGPLEARLRTTEGVAQVLPTQVNPAGDAALITALPTTGPQDEATEDLVHRLRNEVVPSAMGDSSTVVHVGGTTAASIDQSEYMAGRLPLFIGAVVALSFLLLMVVFRSVLVALKAAIMNLLSIGAAYGVMASAAEGGWFGDFVGITEATPVPAFIPMLMFAILFGLSMDYEVFLLSRVREEYLRTGDNGLAVADGLASTARVITAAAAIMVAVFAAFIPSEQIFLKVIGIGLATAIFVDATIVRLVLVPATMELLGDRNWWFPNWLDRVTPNVRIEGEPAAVDAPGSQPGVVGAGA